MANTQRYIDLNVGGTHYTTSVETLTRYPDSMLATMFSQENIPLGRDKSGRYIIDRDGQAFRYVLNFLRGGNLNLPTGFNNFDQLMEEVDFYQLDDMKELLQLKIMLKQDNNSWKSWTVPNMADATVRLENNKVFAMAKEANVDVSRKIQSITTGFGRPHYVTSESLRSIEYNLDCDPTTFQYLVNFDGGRANANYIPKSQAELRRLRDAADKYGLNELTHALDPNIHVVPRGVRIGNGS